MAKLITWPKAMEAFPFIPRMPQGLIGMTNWFPQVWQSGLRSSEWPTLCTKRILFPNESHAGQIFITWHLHLRGSYGHACLLTQSEYKDIFKKW